MLRRVLMCKMLKGSQQKMSSVIKFILSVYITCVDAACDPSEDVFVVVLSTISCGIIIEIRKFILPCTLTISISPSWFYGKLSKKLPIKCVEINRLSRLYNSITQKCTYTKVIVYRFIALLKVCSKCAAVSTYCNLSAAISVDIICKIPVLSALEKGYLHWCSSNILVLFPIKNFFHKSNLRVEGALFRKIYKTLR